MANTTSKGETFFLFNHFQPISIIGIGKKRKKLLDSQMLSHILGKWSSDIKIPKKPLKICAIEISPPSERLMPG